MRLSQKISGLAVLLALLSTGDLWAAGEGRMLGTVADDQGNPVPGVVVTITSPDLSSFNEKRETKKNGTFSVVFAKAYLRYMYRLEKEGFQIQEYEVKTNLGGTTRHTFEIFAGTTASALADTASEVAQTSNAVINIFNQGVAAFEAKDMDTAKAKFMSAIEQDPEFSQAYTALAELLLDTREYNEAVTWAEKALEKNPRSEPAMRVRYNAYHRLGDKENATKAQEALKAAGQASDEAKRIYNSGVELHKTGDVAGALVKFQEAIGMDPDLLPAYTAAMQLYFTDKNHAKAAELADQIVEKDPKNDTALRVRYDSYVALGDEEKVGQALLDLAAIDQDFALTTLFNKGINAYNGGNIEAAKGMFEKVQAIKADHPKANYYLGLCFVNDGDTAKAKELLQRFIDLAPDDPEAVTAKEMIGYL